MFGDVWGHNTVYTDINKKQTPTRRMKRCDSDLRVNHSRRAMLKPFSARPSLAAVQKMLPLRSSWEEPELVQAA